MPLGGSSVCASPRARQSTLAGMSMTLITAVPLKQALPIVDVGGFRLGDPGGCE
jgi:hypothetical protein